MTRRKPDHPPLVPTKGAPVASEMIPLKRLDTVCQVKNNGVESGVTKNHQHCFHTQKGMCLLHKETVGGFVSEPDSPRYA
ncbi:MAG: hypothetical protein IPL73_26915 [Candidatus Obscuribacter sp.]|nr:hypothetical protein [Candidatus Obscuribacter sp.]